MNNSTKTILKGFAIGVGVLGVLGIVYYVFKDKTENKSESKSESKKDDLNIIIGDSQTPFIARQSKKIKMLGQTGGENVLWKGGMGLSWLKNAVSKYPVNSEVDNVIINIGTNGGFNSKDDISGLVKELKRVFPKAKLFVVKGSWGWGGNKSVTESKVNSYYDKFAEEGVKIINPAIGSVKDPHGNLPIYIEIGKSIDSKI